MPDGREFSIKEPGDVLPVCGLFQAISIATAFIVQSGVAATWATIAFLTNFLRHPEHTTAGYSDGKIEAANAPEPLQYGGPHDQRNGGKIDGRHPTNKEDALVRAPMKLHVKKNKLHKDLGKTPGAKIPEADVAKEKSKGGVYAKRAQFVETAKKWNHLGKGKR